MMLPGSGSLLTAVEAQAERSLVVDSSVGRADLFANEVVAAMGSDPYAGLVLSERLAAIKAAEAKARAEAELAERKAREEARPQPPPTR